MNGAIYGLLLFVVFEVFTRRLPQPTGSIIMYALLTAQLTSNTVICWRRTGLPYWTAAGVVAAAMFAYLTVCAATGQLHPHWSPAAWVPMTLAAVFIPVCFWLESTKNPRKWQAWRDHADRITAWESLRGSLLGGRGIPYLRDGRA